MVTKPSKEMPDRVLTLPEAAEVCGCSLATLRRHVAAGNLAVMRLGRRCVRVRHQAVDEFLRRAEDGELEALR